MPVQIMQIKSTKSWLYKNVKNYSFSLFLFADNES